MLTDLPRPGTGSHHSPCDTLWFTHCGHSSVLRTCHALSSGPFFILFSLLETLSAPLHISLSSHSTPACLTPQ